MSMGATLQFDLPQGWTVRKIAVALAGEWLLPFRAVPAVKAARWILQPVVENPNESEAPLWEPGISTQDYQERMERPDLRWVIRASFGRGRTTILARLAMSAEHPAKFQVACSEVSYPESLFDADKLSHFLEQQGQEGANGLFGALLSEKGFHLAAV